MNLYLVKKNTKKNTLPVALSTSNPFKSYAESEYDKKKQAQIKSVHEQIYRASVDMVY